MTIGVNKVILQALDVFIDKRKPSLVVRCFSKNVRRKVLD